jgi:hypothetical protein
LPWDFEGSCFGFGERGQGEVTGSRPLGPFWLPEPAHVTLMPSLTIGIYSFDVLPWMAESGSGRAFPVYDLLFVACLQRCAVRCYRRQIFKEIGRKLIAGIQTLINIAETRAPFAVWIADAYIPTCRR